MSPLKTSREYLEELSPLLGSVPAAALDFVCSSCLGPASLRPDAPMWWPQCFPCKRLFDTAPPALGDRFIAATTVLDPSPWYTRLATYKRSAPALLPAIASVAWQFVHTHRDRFESLLGGQSDGIVLVPSTKGTALELQGLYKAVSKAAPLREQLIPAARHSGTVVGRQRYVPLAFDVDKQAVAGRRLIVLDDTWVTGARLISVCGALLDAGAQSVVPFAIARDVNAGWCGSDHPYRREMARPYNVADWPRG